MASISSSVTLVTTTASTLATATTTASAIASSSVAPVPRVSSSYTPPVIAPTTSASSNTVNTGEIPGLNTTAIAGIAMGSVFLLFFIISVVLYASKRREKGMKSLYDKDLDQNYENKEPMMETRPNNQSYEYNSMHLVNV